MLLGAWEDSSAQPYAKHLIWLLTEHHITTSVTDCHRRVIHNGVRETLMELRSCYWITRGRQVVKKEIYNNYCSVWGRHKGDTHC